jgi:hypothetical protein
MVLPNYLSNIKLRNNMNITQEELIDMICEGVKIKITSMITENKKQRLTESDILLMTEEAILEYMHTSDTSVFGSDNFDYDPEYMAIDHETLKNILDEAGWRWDDIQTVTTPSGDNGVRFTLDITPNKNMSLTELYQEIKDRAMLPNGVRMFKTPTGQFALMVRKYKNE